MLCSALDLTLLCLLFTEYYPNENPCKAGVSDGEFTQVPAVMDGFIGYKNGMSECPRMQNMNLLKKMYKGGMDGFIGGCKHGMSECL